MRPLVVLLRYSLRQILGGKKLAASFLIGAIPVLLAMTVVAVRRSGLVALSPLAFYNDFVPAFFHTWVILASILYASSAVSGDEEDGSVVYLLVRPIRRGVIYLGKVLTAVAATLLVVLPPLVLTYAVLWLGAGGAPAPRLAILFEDLAWIALAAVGYPALFGALSALGRRPLTYAAAYLFIWEFPMAFAPTAVRYLTVSHYLLSVMPHESSWNAAVLLAHLETPVTGSLLGLAALTTLFLAVGSIRYERKEHLTAAGV